MGIITFRPNQQNQYVNQHAQELNIDQFFRELYQNHLKHWKVTKESLFDLSIFPTGAYQNQNHDYLDKQQQYEID